MWCRSLALLLREVMAGSVILPTMDFMADPVSSHMIALVCIFGASEFDLKKKKQICVCKIPKSVQCFELLNCIFSIT